MFIYVLLEDIKENLQMFNNTFFWTEHQELERHQQRAPEVD